MFTGSGVILTPLTGLFQVHCIVQVEEMTRVVEPTLKATLKKCGKETFRAATYTR